VVVALGKGAQSDGRADRLVLLRHGGRLWLSVQDVGRIARHGGSDLLPAVRKAKPEELIVADGTSCRHQIADLSGRVAVHSVRVLADAFL
jgi:hypothetical protein